MKTKLIARIANAEQMLRGVISAAETTGALTPLAAYLDTLVADEVLRQSCADAVTRAESLLGSLRAEEKENRVTAVSICVRLFLWILVHFFC